MKCYYWDFVLFLKKEIIGWFLLLMHIKFELVFLRNSRGVKDISLQHKYNSKIIYSLINMDIIIL